MTNRESMEKSTVDELYKRLDRMIRKLSIDCAYDMPSFWAKNKKTGEKDYVVIPDKYHKGYQQAIKDVWNDINEIFGKEAEE